MVPAPSISFSQSCVCQAAGPQHLGVYMGFQREQTVYKLFFGHLETEDRHCQILPESHMLAILSTNAVFPMEGRAAISTRSERWSPDSL